MIYDVITKSILEKLIDVVNSRIEQGWIPLGAPFAYENWFHQALTLDKNKAVEDL